MEGRERLNRVYGQSIDDEQTTVVYLLVSQGMKWIDNWAKLVLQGNLAVSQAFQAERNGGFDGNPHKSVAIGELHLFQNGFGMLRNQIRHERVGERTVHVMHAREIQNDFVV